MSLHFQMIDKIIYRFKQFYFGMFSVYDRSDEAFARGYLNNEESALFNQLPRFEKKHAVVVARKMLELALYNPELDPQKLVKLGLLHDIGKLAERNSILTKSILVIIRFLLPGLYDWLADRGRTELFFGGFTSTSITALSAPSCWPKSEFPENFFLSLKSTIPSLNHSPPMTRSN